ncbi:MAG: diversity-generating retroelement protein Avd [Candidatus Roizmanbacteria bacterium]
MTNHQAEPPSSYLDLPIITKTYDFYKYLYSCLRLFPKKDRHTLGQKLDTLTLSILELVIAAGISHKERKLLSIEKAIVSVDLLKILIRLSKDVEALDFKRYSHLQELLHEIGRMLGGWKKSLQAF